MVRTSHSADDGLVMGFDTINIEWSRVSGYNLKTHDFLCLKIFLDFNNKEAASCSISSASTLFAEVTLRCFQYTKC